MIITREQACLALEFKLEPEPKLVRVGKHPRMKGWQFWADYQLPPIALAEWHDLHTLKSGNFLTLNGELMKKGVKRYEI